MIVHALKSYLREGVPLTCRCCFLWHSKMWFPIFRTMLQRTVTKTTSSRGSFLPGHPLQPCKTTEGFFLNSKHYLHFSILFILQRLEKTPPAPAPAVLFILHSWKRPLPPQQNLETNLCLVGSFGNSYCWLWLGLAVPPCVVSMQQRLNGSCEKAGMYYSLGALYEPKIRRGQCVLENIQIADEGEEPGKRAATSSLSH